MEKTIEEWKHCLMTESLKYAPKDADQLGARMCVEIGMLIQANKMGKSDFSETELLGEIEKMYEAYYFLQPVYFGVHDCPELWFAKKDKE
ncbi:hypothetical protein M2444_005331 [Paenibacillus sp. PastF-3]|uniref:hypothetical protein n=1 Tax=Paenibacillus sp. PastF-3 TaxID=2940626 RepID=UPI002474BDF4|nr:hypothetical protein [Paenibacillus sp. PastF-3]MDH6373499.1 hypothetical protein [Paenibacillus sp. PastF-3]